MSRVDFYNELNADDFTKRLAVNVVGAKVATDTVLPLLKDGEGSLLFTGGGVALHPSPHYTSMSVGKVALRAYVQALFAAQAGKGVHVATVTIAGNIGSGPGFEPERIAQTTSICIPRHPTNGRRSCAICWFNLHRVTPRELDRGFIALTGNHEAGMEVCPSCTPFRIVQIASSEN